MVTVQFGAWLSRQLYVFLCINVHKCANTALAFVQYSHMNGICDEKWFEVTHQRSRADISHSKCLLTDSSICNCDEVITCFLSDNLPPKNRQSVNPLVKLLVSRWRDEGKLFKADWAVKPTRVWSVRCLQHIKLWEFLRLQKVVENQKELNYHSEKTCWEIVI